LGDHGTVVSVERFAAFRRIVLADTRLQARLRSIDAWPPSSMRLSQSPPRKALALTADDVAAAREESRRFWRERWV